MRPNTYTILINGSPEADCYIESFEDVVEIVADYDVEITAEQAEQAIDVNDDFDFGHIVLESC